MKSLISVFSFRGRISRKVFLLRFVILFLFAFVVNAMFPGALAYHEDTLIAAIQAIVIFTYIWCFWANSAKRWHDTNRSAVYTAVMILPIAGVVLNVLLNALIGGTPGPNRFGEPPAS
jgi:uncharacterized membrane protein YhaH (DUF805 family)